MPVLLLCHKEQLTKHEVRDFAFVSIRKEGNMDGMKKHLPCKLLGFFENLISSSPISGYGRVTSLFRGIYNLIHGTQNIPKKYYPLPHY